MEKYIETALNISKYILSRTPMSNLRLQKILYFIQGEMYRKYGRPAFEDTIEAWKHGPVVPDVYYEFCAYGGSAISVDEDVQLHPCVKETTDEIVNRYKDMYIWDLVEQTHRVGTPWDEIYSKYGGYSVIPDDMIREYFVNG